MQDTGATEPMTDSLPSRRRGWVIGTVLALLVLPLLFSSTPSFIAWPRLGGLVLALILARQAFPRGLDRRMKCIIAGLAVACISSWTGGWLNHADMIKETQRAAGGFLAVTGLGVLIAVILARPCWQEFTRRGLVALLVLLLIPSFAGYFLPIQRLMELGQFPGYYDPTRLPLIWPTRLLMAWAGQLGWEHTNHAGLVFSVGFILLMDFMAGGKAARKPLWWLLAIALGAAIFLTGSRSAWLMLIAALPLALIGREMRWIIRCVLVCAASLGLGMAALEAKEALVRIEIAASPVPPPPPPPYAISDFHVKGLVNRGSAGRMEAYKTLWRDLEGSRIFGKGLGENGKPLIRLMHEHSSYLATLRGGGGIALLAHAGIILTSLTAALRLFRSGMRWPLVLSAGVLAALLFDRGSVFIVNGSYEFLFHWVAVLLPVLLVPGTRPPKEKAGGG